MPPYVNPPKRRRPLPASPVLIGVITRIKDMEIVKSKHWYRIPIRFAPKGRADYLAFYQTKEFGDEGESINYYTKISDCQIVKRRELLPDEESHPRGGEDYYKLSLGKIMRTPHRIYNEAGRRVTFLFTTLAKLKSAREITDLYLRSPIEEIMLRELKCNMINASYQHYLFEENRCICRLDFAIFCNRGKIAIECEGSAWHERYEDQLKDMERENYLASRGWIVLRFPAREIFKDINKCIVKVKKAIDSLGGQLQ